MYKWDWWAEQSREEPVSMDIIEGCFEAINEGQFVSGNYDQGDEETYEDEDSKSNTNQR